MHVRQLFDPASSTYTYLVWDEASREAALIDPVREQIDRDLQLIAELGLSLRHTLDTHVHADHVTAAGAIRERTGVRTVMGRLGAACADVQLADGESITLGESSLRAMDTPGHTDDSVSYLIKGAVFTGDALLIRGCGRTDFQNGDPGTLYRSVTERIFALPDETIVWPAHDYRGQTSSTVGEEKRFNPRLAGRTREEFVAIMAALQLPPPAKLAEAVPANRACGMPDHPLVKQG
jgi:glyoxylase-like metal-dependent hydrolase (beta-lactamase superfamily II)